MADQDQRAAFGDVALALVVHLGDQRAGGVEDGQASGGGFFLDPAGDAMGAEHGDRIGRDLMQVLDEHRALGLQAFDHVFVMHDLMPHIDRRTVLLQRALDDLDGAHDAGAEPARLGQNDLHGAAIKQAAPWSCRLRAPGLRTP